MRLSRVPSVFPFLLASLLFLVAAAGCSSGDTNGGSPNISDEDRLEPVVEEPDIYQRDGNTLYVQNRVTGLNVIDLSDPARPALLGRAPVIGGRGSQIYSLPDNLIVVMLDAATSSCRSLSGLSSSWQPAGEIALVDVSTRTAPQVLGRYCVPGELLDSRVVAGATNVLYAVSGNPMGSGSRAFSVLIDDPRAPKVVSQVDFPGEGQAIFVTPSTIDVASLSPSSSSSSSSGGAATRVQHFTITTDGTISARGFIDVPGSPQGRFHMDLRGAQLRIVTAENSSSRLSVIDFSSADKPRVLGDLTGIAPFQRLYATRFDGDLAYVVTFRRVDPLHVISLKDPTDPRLVGELSVPGWSDFIYPHGDRLLAVGRGDGGQFVGVSYFDVSDPSRPFTIDQLQFGTPSAESEANLDHRGLTIAWDADPPYLVVPFSSVKWGKDSSQRRTCSATSALQLVEMGKLGLVKRGSLGAPAPVRRSFPVDDAQGNPTELISISDYQVQPIDLTARDTLRTASPVVVGDTAAIQDAVLETCNASLARSFVMPCSFTPGRLPPSSSPFFLLLALLTLTLSRRR